MTRWQKWLTSQSEEVKKEICQGQQITKQYMELKIKPISFDELKNLDSKFIVSD